MEAAAILAARVFLAALYAFSMLALFDHPVRQE